MSGSSGQQVAPPSWRGSWAGELWRVPSPTLFAAVALAYAFTAYLAVEGLGTTGLQAVLYAPAGLTFAALVRAPRRQWWVVLAAAGSVEALRDVVSQQWGPAAVAGYTLANVLGPLAGASLSRRLAGHVRLEDRRHVMATVAGGVLLGPTVSATVGTAADVWFADGTWARTWPQWWVGDAAGVAVAGVAVLAWATTGPHRRPTPLLLGILAVGGAVAGGLTYSVPEPAPLLVLVALTTAALVRGGAGVAVAGLGVAVGASAGLAYLSRDGLSDTGTLAVKVRLVVFMVTALLIATVTHDRERARRDAETQRRRAEEARRMATALDSYRQLFEGTRDGLFVADADGRLIDANPAAAELLGYPTAELLDRRIVDIVDPAEADRVAATLAGLGDRPFVRGPWRLLRKDGETVIGDTVITGLPEGRVQAVVRDVTAEERTRELLAASEAQLRSVFSSIDEGFTVAEMLVDEAGRAVDYRFLDVNPLFEEMTGLQDPVGRTARELVPGLEDHWVQTYARVALDGESLRFEQGSEAMGRWFDVFATPLAEPRRFAIVFKDVTERREAAAALQESLRFSDEVTSLVPGVVYVFDLLERRNVFANRSTGDLLGYPPEEVLAMGEDFVPQVLHPDDSAAFGAHVAGLQSLRDGETRSVEYRFRHRDGTWRWFSSSDVVLRRDPDGRVTQVIGLALDISDRKVVEARLAAAAQEDSFRARLADELRTADDPAAAARAAVGLLESHIPAQRIEYLHRDGATGRMQLLAHCGPDAILAPTGPAEAPGDGADDPVTDTSSAVVGRVVRDEGLVGLLVLQSDDPGAAASSPLVQEAAERTWTAVQRLRTSIAERRRHRRAEALADVLTRIEQVRGVEPQAVSLVQAVTAQYCDHAVIEVPGRDTPLATHQAPAAHGGADGGSPSAHSQMAAPLSLPDGTTATLRVARADPARDAFDAEDRIFLDELCDRVARVLFNAHLHEQEHAIAVRLQRSLLPDRIAQDPRLPMVARYVAGDDFLQVGGDWYDTFTWEADRVGVIVGDVVGHSMDSAAAMGRLRSACSALVASAPVSAAGVLDALEFAARGPNGAQFATAACVTVDLTTGLMHHAAAGHPPVVVCRPGETPVLLTEGRTRPICFPYVSDEPGPRPEGLTQLTPGTLVLMYSDGLVERRETLLSTALGKLSGVVAAAGADDLDDVADAVLRVMVSDSPTSDDVVLMCMRYLGPGGVSRHRIATA